MLAGGAKPDHFSYFGRNSPTVPLQRRNFSRRGFSNTQPKLPFWNHFDLWLCTQSTTSTTPTMPPVSSLCGTEIPCFCSARLMSSVERLKLACISNGTRRCVRQERFSMSFTPLTISQAHGWRTESARNRARLDVPADDK